MLNLVVTTDKMQLVTSAAVAVDVHASYVDLSGTTATPGRKNTAISTATTTDIVLAPGASTFRNIKMITARNKGAASVDVTVVFNENGTSCELHKATLAPGEVLIYSEQTGFIEVLSAAALRSVSTSDQAIGASTTAALTGSALSLADLKVGTVLKWVVCMTKTAAATAAQTFNVRFGTTGGTGDTSQLSFSTGTQTAAADAAEVEIRVVVRNVSATGVVHGNFELQHNLASTGFAPTANVIAQATSATFDLTTAGLLASLSTTTGASHAITVHQVIAERINP